MSAILGKYHLCRVLGREALMCHNNGIPNRLSNSNVVTHSFWRKLSTDCSRSHTGAISKHAQTHDRTVSKACIGSFARFAISKYSSKSSKILASSWKDLKTVHNDAGKGYLFIGQRHAATMSGKGPGLIVFDLDCTLWPHHVDTTVNPPFIQENSKVVDQDGVTITYYPEVPKVLEYLKSEGYTIAAASRTTKPPAAEQLLQFFDWNKYFKYKEIYPGSKVTHFQRFVEKTQIPHNQMLFFDDEQRNIIDMEKEGVKCVLVKDGANLQLVKDSIEKFKNGTL